MAGVSLPRVSLRINHGWFPKLMCGICGVIGLPASQARPATERMARAMVHRGPDDEGLHHADDVTFAFRRLSILDVAGGHQPLFNEDRSVALIANGEIYNHRLLRKELEQQGHRFATASDCETILHSYEQYGDDFLPRLRGMFAFAIHDMARGRVILARDRLGEKPLYVCDNGKELIFASELRSILASGLIPTKFDRSSLYTFFHFGFIPEPYTAISGIHKLPAGHYLNVDLATGRRSTVRYWSFQDSGAEPADASVMTTTLDEISSFITDADVPVGVSLSGGLDSGTIAILAAARAKRSLHAFTVGYDLDIATDETSTARQVAKYAGLTFHPVRVTTNEVVASYPETVWLKDDPNSDIAGPAYLAIMRAARGAGVPVILLGQGADELFWGYDWVVEAARRSRAIRDGTGAILKTWLQRAGSRTVKHQQVLRRIVRRLRALATDCRSLLADIMASRETLRFYDTLPTYQQAHASANFFAAALLRDVDQTRLTQPAARPEVTEAAPEAAILQLICDTYLRENGLGQADRLSMAASVEVRNPLVDYRLAELAYAHQVASSPRIDIDKKLIRDAARKVCPPWMADCPKRGFTPPVMLWRRSIVQQYAQLVDGGLLVEHGIITADAGRRVAAAKTNPRNPPSLYHDAIDLELWCRQILAGAPLPAEPR